MNYSTAILVINDDARAIMVTYEDGENAPREMFKTFDKSINVNDYVVVPTSTRHKLTVCKVVEVDVDSWMETSQQINWIIGRVDVADANAIKEKEEQAIVAIKAAEKMKRRRELQKSMEDALAENSDALKLLSATPTDEEPKQVA